MTRRSRTLAHLCLCMVSLALALAGPAGAARPTRATAITPTAWAELRWRNVGPFRGGRTRAVAGDPTRPSVMYIGVCNGGVWKSTDYGRVWTPIFDAQPTQSIGAIAVAPSDPSVLYVGSGEGLHRPDLSVGDGIYRSNDAGATWTHLGLRDAQQIPALAVDPRDPDRVFAAVLGHPYGPSAERGLYLSTDGGRNFRPVLQRDENTGASDVEIDPTDPEIVYAGFWEARSGPWEDNNKYNGPGGGLFKSSDGGRNWRQLKTGLPDSLSQIDVAVAPSRPGRLYAVLATTEPGDYESGAGLGVFRSDDFGESWTRATRDERPTYRIGGGDLPMLGVDPRDADVVYSASLVTLRSTDAGATWTSLRGAPGGDDYQNVYISPADPQVILLASDQGAVASVNRGLTWSSWYNQPTAQLYHIGVTPTFPYRVCSGQQESGSVCISSRGDYGAITFRDWRPVGAIEYGTVTPDPLDPDIIYGAGRSYVSKYRWSTAQTQNISPVALRDRAYRSVRTAPLVFSPLEPRTLYFALNVLFRTRDGGDTWDTISPDLSRDSTEVPAAVGARRNAGAERQRGVIYSVAPSHVSPGTIWAGTDDGQVWLTRDAGAHWSNITPPGLTAWSKVTQIEASRWDDQSAYLAVSRQRVDDQKAWLFRTHDGGQTWQFMGAGLPPGPANSIRADPVRRGLLFAGTENAVWVSFDDGDLWHPLQQNLPHTSMRELKIHENDLIVATHGRGFWILDDLAPLRELTPAALAADAFLFTPAPAWRVRRSLNTDTPLPADEPMGQNPPDGAIIDYHLAKPAAGPVLLEILDADGRTVRRYASTDTAEVGAAALAAELIPGYWRRPERRLATSAGMHRFTWDLHGPPPAGPRGFPMSAIPGDTPREPPGIALPPGRYAARLTVAGRALTAGFELKMDPRVTTPPEQILRQYELLKHLRVVQGRLGRVADQARDARRQVAARLKDYSGPLGETLKLFDADLRRFLDGVPPAAGAAPAPPPPTPARVTGGAASLYASIGAVDAPPTGTQSAACARLGSEEAAVTGAWARLEGQLSALNAQLRAARLPEVRLGADPPSGESAGDDD